MKQSPVDAYLEQRVLSATPEQQMALLMEAGQLFIGKAIKAIETKDYFNMAKHLGRVNEILLEAMVRLNLDAGGELVNNLYAIYDWWMREVMDASRLRDSEKLLMVSKFMGELRHSWEQVASKQPIQTATLDYA
jgi:flagellar protein FliS